MASPRQVIQNFIEDTYKIKLPMFGDYTTFGIRGAIPDKDGDILPTKNEFNKYDDTIGWLTPTERYMTQGTVEPGKKYTDKPMNTNGVFYLKNGLYVMVRADHFKMSAFNISYKYPKEGTPLEGYRDTLRLGKNPFDVDPKAEIYRDATGIDTHAGGENPDNIDGWSAGCQVILGGWKSKAWLDYKEPLYKSKQLKFLYCLLNYSDIAKALEA